MTSAIRAIARDSGSSIGSKSGGSQRSRVVASAKSAASAFAPTQAPAAPPTPRFPTTTNAIIPTSVSTGDSSWITFQSRMRPRPSRTPEIVCQITFGTSEQAASSPSRKPSPAVSDPQIAIRPLARPPASSAIAKARRTSPRRSGCSWRRFVTATPSWPSRREKIVTLRTARTKAPRPSGCRKRLWRTTSTIAVGVESPRKSSVSIVTLPAFRAAATSGVLTRFGVTGGAISTPGADRTAVTALGRASVPTCEATGDLAAVDGDHRAGQVGAVVGGKEGEERGDLLGSRVPAERDLRVGRAQHLRRVLGLLHRREHVAGADVVDVNLRRELERHRPRERDHAGLGGVVVGVQRVPDEPVRRGRDQDRAAVGFRSDHPPRRLLGAVERPVEVDGEDAPPLVGREL